MPRSRKSWEEKLALLRTEYSYMEFYLGNGKPENYVEFVSACIDRIIRENPVFRVRDWKENCKRARQRIKFTQVELAERLGVTHGAIQKLERINVGDVEEKQTIEGEKRYYLEALSYLCRENPYKLLGVEPQITANDVVECQKSTDILSNIVNSHILAIEEMLHLQAIEENGGPAGITLSMDQKVQLMKNSICATPVTVLGSTEVHDYIEYILYRYRKYLSGEDLEYVQDVAQLLALQHKSAKERMELFEKLPAVRKAVSEAELPEEDFSKLCAIKGDEAAYHQYSKLFVDLGGLQDSYPSYIVYIGKTLLVPHEIQELLHIMLRDGGLLKGNLYTERETSL